MTVPKKLETKTTMWSSSTSGERRPVHLPPISPARLMRLLHSGMTSSPAPMETNRRMDHWPTGAAAK